MRSSFAAPTTGAAFAAKSARLRANTITPSAFAAEEAATPASRTSAGFPISRTFIPFFRFSLLASIGGYHEPLDADGQYLTRFPIAPPIEPMLAKLAEELPPA